MSVSIDTVFMILIIYINTWSSTRGGNNCNIVIFIFEVTFMEGRVNLLIIDLLNIHIIVVVVNVCSIFFFLNIDGLIYLFIFKICIPPKVCFASVYHMR